MSGWVPRLPLGWSEEPVKRFGDVTLGKMLQSSAASAMDVLGPYMRAANVQPDGVLALGDAQSMWFSPAESSALSLCRGDVVVVEGGVGGYGRAAYLSDDLPGWGFQNSINRVRPRAQHDGRFITYCLIAARQMGWIRAYCNVVSMPHLTAEKLAALRIPLPPSELQRPMADYLDRETAKIDTLVAKQRQLIETLRERRAAVSADVGAPRGEKVATSRIKYLYKVVDVRASDKGAGGCELPLLSVSIHTGVQRRDSTTDALARAEDLSNYKVCNVGDIVINRMRAFQGALGIVGENGIVSPDYLVLRARPGCDPKWLTRVLKSTWFVGEMAARIRGVGSADLGAARTPRINESDLGDIDVEVSSLRHQLSTVDALDEQTGKIDALIERTQRFIELSTERRSAVISAVVTGQIEVSFAAKGESARLATVTPMKRPSRKPAHRRPSQIAAKGGPRSGNV